MIWSAIAYTVTPNIHPWHIDSPPVCPGHPSATCIATHGNTPRKPFFNKTMLHTTRMSQHYLPPHYYPSLSTGFPDLSPIKHI
ncbi:hypothetical protein TNCV_4826671 [Trichonephila clavipes]|nr:hypothetical protein TNCV_4826671 [Trichonephila clavipes]